MPDPIPIRLKFQRVPPIVCPELVRPYGTGCSGGDTLATAATQRRYNRTITVDFHDETTYFHLLNDGKGLCRKFCSGDREGADTPVCGLPIGHKYSFMENHGA